MNNQILINATPYETRVALLEDGELAELYIERSGDKGIVGNIYKGKVVRVLPGMQAAFVEVGLERTAFLHVSDIYDTWDEVDFDREGDSYPGKGKRLNHLKHGKLKGSVTSAHAHIEDILKMGQDILVQVLKEPLGTKGARLTSYISLPGRNLVFMPNYDHIGVSKRIENEKEKRRLRDIVQNARTPGSGFIIRTASEGSSREEIERDMDFLMRLWRAIQERWEETSAPALLYHELDLIIRTLRDLFTDDVKRVTIDSPVEYDKVIRFVDTYMPHLRPFVKLYEGSEPVFDYYGVETQISNAMEKRVWLKSGGYIVIDQTEALTTIDVNTGKYVGKRNPEDTILKTNLEAAKEIVYQLRLRNIGGIIVIDFIDMEMSSSKNKIYRTLKELLKKGRAKTTINHISELGLVEMTRKRVRESLIQSLCCPCPYCEGRGFIKSKMTVVMDIYRALIKEVSTMRKRKITLYVHPEIAECLYDEMRDIVCEVEKNYRKRIVIKSMNLFHLEQFEIS